MSASDNAINKPSGQGVLHEGSPFAEAPPNWFDSVEQRIERLGERLNPILIKEARQALKSRQFVMTFLLLLICGWGWSMIYLFYCVNEMGEGVYYAPHGSFMLMGFYWVLSFPMLVIVPFTAFRSLSAEREDGTFELVSITTLAPRQIISGKLGSAVLQMLLFLSALAPGMAFTYMLRGVDLVLILMICTYLFMASVLLSVLGLLLATVTNSRAWQMVLGVIFVLSLTLNFIITGASVHGAIWSLSSLPYDQMEFWALQQFIVSIYLGYLALLFLASAARITFESDNRSTKLRIAMLGIHALGIGWGMWLWLTGEESEMLYIMISLLALQWGIWGGLMIGESSELSPRARRSLPQSFLARMFLTWFNPGPGTGYLFTVVNMFSMMVIVFVAAAFSNMVSFGGRIDQEQVMFALFAFCYVVFYVGLTRLVMRVVEIFVYPNIFLSLLLLILLLIGGAAAPMILGVAAQELWNTPFDYSVLQVSNWAWSLGAAAEDDLTQIGFMGISVESIIIVLVSGSVLLINLVLDAREVDPDRVATPQRVIEEEKELHPEKFAEPIAPGSPWDEDETEQQSDAT